MSLINVDTTEEALKRPEYQPLEPGEYILEINNELKVEPSKNPNSQYDRIEVHLKEMDTGKTVKDWLSMNPSMKWKLSQFVASSGVGEDENGQVDLEEFKGVTVTALVTQETYEKKDGTQGLSNKVDRYVYEN